MTALKFSRKHLGIPYALFMALFVVFPLLLIIYYAFTDPTTGKVSLVNFIDFFTSNANLTAMFISLALAILTTAICLLIAYPAAYILARTDMNKNGVMLLLFILPMWINFVLRTAAMKELLFTIGMFNSNKTSFINM